MQNGINIYKYDIYRGPNIGIYATTNDSITFLPRGYAKTKGERLGKYLDSKVVYTSVANTRLIGILMVANNHGLLLPSTTTEIEYNYFKKVTDLNVSILDSNYTALGNLICANDRGALVSPEISTQQVKEIEDVLDVDVIQKKIAGYHQVGAMASANMHGGIINPETDEDDINIFSNILKVKIEPATVNGGVPFISSGVLINNKAIVVGSFTTGPEIMMFTRVFVN